MEAFDPARASRPATRRGKRWGAGRRGAVIAIGRDRFERAAAIASRPGTPRVICCGSRAWSATIRPVGMSWRESLGVRSIESRSPRRSRPRCYRMRDEAIREVFPTTSELADKLVRSAPASGITIFSWWSSGPTAAASSSACQPGPTAAPRRHQHEAAGAQAARVHVGGPPLVRGDRHPQPARVRPGLLRQRGRRARRRQADRRALQGPGLRACPRARPAGVDRLARADDRDLLVAPEPGEFYSAIPTSAWTS